MKDDHSSALAAQEAGEPTQSNNANILASRSKLPAKAAPESEDEAFERAWSMKYQSNPSNMEARFLKETAREFWNARARLDAERRK